MSAKKPRVSSFRSSTSPTKNVQWQARVSLRVCLAGADHTPQAGDPTSIPPWLRSPHVCSAGNAEASEKHKAPCSAQMLKDTARAHLSTVEMNMSQAAAPIEADAAASSYASSRREASAQTAQATRRVQGAATRRPQD